MASLPQLKSNAARSSAAPSGAAPQASAARLAEVDAALELVRPAIRDDEGDVALVDVVSRSNGDVVLIQFQGACTACPSSEMTLKHGIEKHLVDQVPGIVAVEAVEV